jgi:15-cis-phytoene synthase
MPPHWTDAEAADLAVCRTMLRGGSRSFDAAAHLLPRSVRDPAVALYAFCRVADDAIDRGVAGELAALRERLALAYEGRPLSLPIDRAFASIVRQNALPRILPEALLEGFAWDAEGRRYEDLPALRGYAVRVAGTVGVMMALLMGVRDANRVGAAVDLGVAMQLTNIARDVGEDARIGRLYLPLDWLEQAGIDPDRFLECPRHSAALGHVIQRLLDAAKEHYSRAWAGIARLPPICRLGIGAAGLLYAEIGHEVARRGLNAIDGRAIVSGRRKAWTLMSGLPRLALPPLSDVRGIVPEAAFLLEALGTPQRPAAQPHWWRLQERMHWIIDLLERMEQRERQIARRRQAAAG